MAVPLLENDSVSALAEQIQHREEHMLLKWKRPALYWPCAVFGPFGLLVIEAL